MKKYMKNKYNWFLVSGPIIAYAGMKLTSLKIIHPWLLNFAIGWGIVFIGVHLGWMSWLGIAQEIKEDEYDYNVID
ncbi:hypothetical protein AALM99_06110 [Lactococcus muris]|uniref:Uncharacterized protein n=1 Tax=Lactococcus muris TaxID=2941330 RepID=A0ABV4DBQ5_9LACT|nr:MULTISPECIES: hypothetical protein [Lactococcus]